MPFLMIRNDITKVAADAIGYGVEKMVNIQRHLPEEMRAAYELFRQNLERRM